MSDMNLGGGPQGATATSGLSQMLQAAMQKPAPHNRITSGWLYQLVSQFIMIGFNVVAMPAEVFLRYSFGERFLDIFMVILAYLFTLFFTALSGVMGPMTSSAMGLGIFAQLFAVMTIFHILYRKYHNFKGTRWHSFSPGVPWPFILRPIQWTVVWIARLLPKSWLHGEPTGYAARAELVAITFVEPIIWILLSVPAVSIFGDAILPFWIITGGALVGKCSMMRHFSRNEILDAIDQQLENQHREAVMTGQTAPHEAAGYMVYAPPVSRAAQATVTSAYENLSPNLRDLVTAEADADAALPLPTAPTAPASPPPS